jgi:isocitrate dehydrogenase
MANTPITVAHGDGIGPEIMAARLHILNTRKILGLYANADNRGTKVWPNGFPDTVTSDVFRCRFIGTAAITSVDAAALVSKAAGAGLDVAKYESLYNFDGKAGFSLGQRQ